MWMDWERSYYTMTDTNIEYIWGFLKECHERGWLYSGHRPMVVVPALRHVAVAARGHGTDSYRDVTHPSLYVRFRSPTPAARRCVVWTTTPWTLPANVAAAVQPDAEYVRVERAGRAGLRRRRARRGGLRRRGRRGRAPCRGSELVGRPYARPVRRAPRAGRGRSTA